MPNREGLGDLRYQSYDRRYRKSFDVTVNPAGVAICGAFGTTACQPNTNYSPQLPSSGNVVTLIYQIPGFVDSVTVNSVNPPLSYDIRLVGFSGTAHLYATSSSGRLYLGQGDNHPDLPQTAQLLTFLQQGERFPGNKNRLHKISANRPYSDAIAGLPGVWWLNAVNAQNFLGFYTQTEPPLAQWLSNGSLDPNVLTQPPVPAQIEIRRPASPPYTLFRNLFIERVDTASVYVVDVFDSTGLIHVSEFWDFNEDDLSTYPRVAIYEGNHFQCFTPGTLRRPGGVPYYEVQVDPQQSYPDACTCPDFTQINSPYVDAGLEPSDRDWTGSAAGPFNPCKHIMAVKRSLGIDFGYPAGDFVPDEDDRENNERGVPS